MSDFSDLLDDLLGAIRRHKVITAVVLVVGFWIVASMMPEPEGARAARIMRDVTTGCQALVRGQLKAPATAKFPDPYVIKGNLRASSRDSVVWLDSYVDAQNSFGALIRNATMCELQLLPEGGFRPIRAEIIPSK